MVVVGPASGFEVNGLVVVVLLWFAELRRYGKDLSIAQYIQHTHKIFCSEGGMVRCFPADPARRPAHELEALRHDDCQLPRQLPRLRWNAELFFSSSPAFTPTCDLRMDEGIESHGLHLLGGHISAPPSSYLSLPSQILKACDRRGTRTYPQKTE